jgi:hypothetical protein
MPARIDFMEKFDIDAYRTNRGWVARAAKLNPLNENEIVHRADLSFRDDTEDSALRRGAGWVLSKRGMVRVVMRGGAPVPPAPYVVGSLP